MKKEIGLAGVVLPGMASIFTCGSPIMRLDSDCDPLIYQDAKCHVIFEPT